MKAGSLLAVDNTLLTGDRSSSRIIGQPAGVWWVSPSFRGRQDAMQRIATLSSLHGELQPNLLFGRTKPNKSGLAHIRDRGRSRLAYAGGVATLATTEGVLTRAGVEFIEENGGGLGVRLRERPRTDRRRPRSRAKMNEDVD